MDSAASSNPVAGPSSEASTPGTYEEGHISITTATTTTTSSAPTQHSRSISMSPFATTAALQMDTNAKDSRNASLRSYEESGDPDQPGPRLRSSRLFKGKGKESVTIERPQKKPLRLLDLPVDILKEIVKEVTHTNDLTSLALCHSALHRLTVPHIYSRFDIVWPDSSTHAEPRSGVDALTYGLATLVMAEEVFGESPSQRPQTNTANRFSPTGFGRATDKAIRRRRGNHYAQFTRKFSLGNGPADWVQEYLITKEGGKMLGTLVALAVARMRSLETFIWDMPTGILRDVWSALSSLDGRDDGKPCRLDKVWVRWHNNSSAEITDPIPQPPPPMNFSDVPSSHLPPDGHHDNSALHTAPLTMLARVEHPAFSVLPPLKSLSVLDIDELAYLDEMAVLIGRSLHKLRELRVGIARHAMTRDWVAVWEGDGVLQVDSVHPTAGSLTIGEKRLGGILGMLTGFVHDIRQSKTALPVRTKHQRAPSEIPLPVDSPATSPVERTSDANFISDPLDTTGLQDMIPDFAADASDAFIATTLIDSNSGSNQENANAVDELVMHGALDSRSQPSPAAPSTVEHPQHDNLSDEPLPPLKEMLRLESLELERIPICVPVLHKAFDWRHLTSLTLLHCPNHEQLWKTLRRIFAPTPRSPTYPHPRRTPHTTPRKAGKGSAASHGEFSLEYQLSLKRIHTNTVSPALISFLKETLAPNSLEVMFLQESRNYSSSVTIEAIFRGPLRRHRSSLKKILIDSSEKNADGMPANSSRWRRWILTHDILDFICSGKMPSLRELGMALDYRDWHFFLQNLPSIPHLRSLYIPFMADHVHGINVDPRELALQIVDIVALRPEIELCYMGIAAKCFEILENRRNSDVSWGDGRPDSQLGLMSGAHHANGGSDDGEEDDDEDGAGDDDEEEMEEVVVEDEDEEHGHDDTESDVDEDEDDDDDADSDLDSSAGGRTGRPSHARLRLREILFYDDKVAVFKARHGRL